MPIGDYSRHRRTEEEDSFFCRFTFGQFFALLVLEVFTLFFVFYLGARYGREFLGLGEAGTAAVEEAAAISEERPGVLTTADPEVAAMAGELVAKADTPELKSRVRQMIADAQGVKGRRPPPVEERGASPAPMEEPLEIEKGRSAEAPPPAREKQSKADAGVIRMKSSGDARYSVQVGSFPQMDEATRSIERWKGKGYPAYLMIADIPDRGRWYRVRIGGFESRGDADRYRREMETREGVEAIVVLNER